MQVEVVCAGGGSMCRCRYYVVCAGGGSMYRWR